MRIYNVFFKAFATICVIYLIIPRYGNTQSLEWVKKIGGVQNDIGNKIAIDNSGNVYTAGGFSSTANFDPGGSNLMLTSNGALDIFITKHDPAGNLVWAKKIGGTGYDEATCIAIYGSRIYVGGFFQSTVDFDPNAGVYNATSAGMSDGFILKLDTVGNFNWVNDFGNTVEDAVYAITTDNLGFIYATGIFSLTVDFDAGSGTSNLTTGFDNDIFICKYGQSGAITWARQFDGQQGQNASLALVVRGADLYITGYFLGPMDFDTGPNTFYLNAPSPGNAFVCKLNSSGGNFNWAKSFSGTGSSQGIDIAIDTAGNIYNCGSFRGTIDFDAGSGTYNLTALGIDDTYIHKMDPSGNSLWTRLASGTGSTYGLAIDFDLSGNIYCAGFFSGTTDFDPGIPTMNVSSAGSQDHFILSLDSLGDYKWVARVGGSGMDHLHDLAIDQSGSMYITGYFSSTTDFDPGSGSFVLNSSGLGDAYLQKLNLVTGVEQYSDSDFSIYPNPTGGYVNIALPKPFDNLIVKITDQVGREVYSEIRNNQLSFEILFNSPSGVYFVLFESKGHILGREKIVKL